jgi:hypothetical protein
MYGRATMGNLAPENYSSLLLCSSSKRLQLRQQDLKSNDIAASEDGGGTALAEHSVNISLCMLEGSSIPEQVKECFSVCCQCRQQPTDHKK